LNEPTLLLNCRKEKNMAFTLANKRVVILADGTFPVHSEPLRHLSEAEFIVCCDGAAATLAGTGLVPGLIIGDMDSLPDDIATRFADRLVADNDPERNDLTKAVDWCWKHGATGATIIGATGKREDHTLGNISLLADYGRMLTVKMITDSAVIFPVYENCSISSFPGQRVSIFSLDPGVQVTSAGLKYPLTRLLLNSWWRATLNISTADSFSLTFTTARLIIYLGHRDLTT
jgi:thiamine pyrophosphokinase